jgi:hypothetical protein
MHETMMNAQQKRTTKRRFCIVGIVTRRKSRKAAMGQLHKGTATVDSRVAVGVEAGDDDFGLRSHDESRVHGRFLDAGTNRDKELSQHRKTWLSIA